DDSALSLSGTLTAFLPARTIRSRLSVPSRLDVRCDLDHDEHGVEEDEGGARRSATALPAAEEDERRRRHCAEPRETEDRGTGDAGAAATRGGDDQAGHDVDRVRVQRLAHQRRASLLEAEPDTGP